MRITFLTICLSLFCLTIQAQARFEFEDVFELENINDPQISPDGNQVVYRRDAKDIMTDGTRSQLWIVNFDGTNNRPLTDGLKNDYHPRWSPDGKQLIYTSNRNGKPQLFLRWMETGIENQLTHFTETPSNFAWSPDGKWLAFTMSVAAESSTLKVKLPKKPTGATWVDTPVYIDKMKYRSDGAGYVKDTYSHIFLLPIDGGHARQLTSGNFNHSGPFSWSADGASVLFSANRHEDAEYEPANSEIYEVNIASGAIKQLTDRHGPDGNPKVSPDGKWIAFTGYDEKYQGYQVAHLYVMERNGKNIRLLSGKLDRDIDNVQWDAAGKGLYFQYDDKGHTKIAFMDLSGKHSDLANEVGGLTFGRPYGGGTFSVANNGRFAYTLTAPDHPADLAVGEKGQASRRLTSVNDDLFSYKKLGAVEEIWYKSSFDQREVQGWICKPPDFDPNKKYPLLLEIHGGPFTNYGWRFSAEVQLYAAAGYVVLYTNPRGSTSYGAEFGNLIHHNYPGQDYDDLMSGVDEVIKKGYIDEDQLYVTGGSGGGVLTAWIVGNTDRFRAAVVAKPVINWTSFVLHSDNPAFFYKYWFPGLPWEEQENYYKRSPLSLAGNVKTPTMLLTGEQDYRTPISETEQYYAALKLNKVETAMVRIQNSGHGITSHPSNLINKVAYILAWFDKYKGN
ncbi:MAG: S9 family peptidase [Saprospiraceae bacterium]